MNSYPKKEYQLVRIWFKDYSCANIVNFPEIKETYLGNNYWNLFSVDSFVNISFFPDKQRWYLFQDLETNFVNSKQTLTILEYWRARLYSCNAQQYCTARILGTHRANQSITSHRSVSNECQTFIKTNINLKPP